MICEISMEVKNIFYCKHCWNMNEGSGYILRKLRFSRVLKVYNLQVCGHFYYSSNFQITDGSFLYLLCFTLFLQNNKHKNSGITFSCRVWRMKDYPNYKIYYHQKMLLVFLLLCL